MMHDLPECERQRSESLRGLIAKMDETRADRLEAECARLRKGMELFRDAVGMTDGTRRELASRYLND